MRWVDYLARFFIGVAGLVCGAYCVWSAYHNGLSMASSDVSGLVFGAAFGAVVVGSWFLLPLASISPWNRAILLRGVYVVCLVFVIVNAIGFTATYRTATVGDKTNTITAYDTALTGLAEERRRIEVMQTNPRWQTTAGCTNATVALSKGFCDQFRAAQVKVDRYQDIVAAGRPGSSDPQAETIAWATGWMLGATSGDVGRAMPVLLAVVLELAASAFIWAAFTTYPSRARTTAIHLSVESPHRRELAARDAEYLPPLAQIDSDPVQEDAIAIAEIDAQYAQYLSEKEALDNLAGPILPAVPTMITDLNPSQQRIRDLVNQFVKDCLIVNVSTEDCPKEAAQTMQNAFQIWMADMNHLEYVSKNDFGVHMTEVVEELGGRRKKSGNHRWYVGVQIKPALAHRMSGNAGKPIESDKRSNTRQLTYSKNAIGLENAQIAGSA